MNKEQLIASVAKKTGLTQKEVRLSVDAMFETITESLQNDQKVTLVGFGTFQVRERAAREGRNPRTGGVIKITAKRSPVFVAGKNLKEVLQVKQPALAGKK